MKYMGRIIGILVVILLIIFLSLYFHIVILSTIIILSLLVAILLYKNILYFKELNNNKELLNNLFNNVDVAFYSSDIKTTKVITAFGVERIFGCNNVVSTIEKLKDIVYIDDIKIIDDIKREFFSRRTSKKEIRIYHRNGQLHYKEISISPVLNKKGKFLKMNVFMHDITEKKRMEMAQLELEKKYSQIFEGSSIGIYFYKNGKITYVNSYLEELLDYTKEEIYSMDILDLVCLDDKPILLKKIQNILNGKKVVFEQLKLIKKDGTSIFVDAYGILSYDGDFGFIGTITKKINPQESISLYQDSLTGLPNRFLLIKHLQNEINNSKDNNIIGIMFIDLERFKLINDTYGFSLGDLLLKLVGERLKRCIPENDIVSRYDGDEFVIVLNSTTEDKIIDVAKKILNEFSNPFLLDGNEVFTVPSIGISLYPKHSRKYEELINYADIAKFHVKENTGNNYKFYDLEYKNIISKKVELENGLRRALINNEFEVYYQPLYNLNTSEIVCLEALIRWNSPIKGLVSPLEFIPLAEEIGLIIPIGNWVLETACRQLKLWQEQGHNNINIAVNISNSQFMQDDFVKVVKNILNKTKLEAKYLELEITESVMRNEQKSTPILRELQDMGIKIAIDDFGTGYSSLSVLKSSSLTNIKIDRSFIKDMENNPNTESIIKTIINVGENLKFNIIAEGIENKKQLDFLKENKCFYGQGYLFSKPLPNYDVLKLF